MSEVGREEIEAFLYLEARLQDESDYDGWEALWTDDALYWVPNGGDDTDPQQEISVIYDNRARIGTRIRQLKSGKRYSQSPNSRLRHLITNVEILSRDGDEIEVGANFMAIEWRLGEARTWAGRTDYGLRLVDGRLRMVSKKVMLVNNDGEIPTLAFLI